jgi:hypothetical protein
VRRRALKRVRWLRRGAPPARGERDRRGPLAVEGVDALTRGDPGIIHPPPGGESAA